jgi:hypothetical protein
VVTKGKGIGRPIKVDNSSIGFATQTQKDKTIQIDVNIKKGTELLRISYLLIKSYHHAYSPI